MSAAGQPCLHCRHRAGGAAGAHHADGLADHLLIDLAVVYGDTQALGDDLEITGREGDNLAPVQCRGVTE